MNNEELRAQAVATIGKVLEEAAYIFTEELPPDDYPVAGSWVARGVELSFSGRLSGTLRLWAGDEFLRYAAANMLGTDEDTPEAQQKTMDALKEILNMIVGNYLTAVYGEEPVFDLGLPQELQASSLAEDIGSESAVWLQAEGNPVLFIVHSAKT